MRNRHPGPIVMTLPLTVALLSAAEGATAARVRF